MERNFFSGPKITKILIQIGHCWIFKYSLAFIAYSSIKWAYKMIFSGRLWTFLVELDWYLLDEYMKREIKHNDPAGTLLGSFLISLSSMFRKSFTSKFPVPSTLERFQGPCNLPKTLYHRCLQFGSNVQHRTHWKGVIFSKVMISWSYADSIPATLQKQGTLSGH